MSVEKFLVPGVSCQHCVRAVTNEVSTIEGVSKVEVNLADKTVTVQHTGAAPVAKIVAAIKEAGFEEVGVMA